MKTQKRKHLQKIFYIAFVVIFISIFYNLYELDLYVWSCDSEENTGSCLLASRLYDKADNSSMTEKYLRKSCTGEYGLGCYELGKFLINDGRKEEGQKVLNLSCEQNHQPACDQ